MNLKIHFFSSDIFPELQVLGMRDIFLTFLLQALLVWRVGEGCVLACRISSQLFSCAHMKLVFCAQRITYSPFFSLHLLVIWHRDCSHGQHPMEWFSKPLATCCAVLMDASHSTGAESGLQCLSHFSGVSWESWTEKLSSRSFSWEKHYKINLLEAH